MATHIFFISRFSTVFLFFLFLFFLIPGILQCFPLKSFSYIFPFLKMVNVRTAFMSPP